jgi:ornithine decarboxylase
VGILNEVYKAGCSFDCASISEIDKVLSLGADAENIIFANPAKTNRAIHHAL